MLFHGEQLFAFAFEHLVDLDAGPARYDRGDIFARHFLAQHGAFSGFPGFGEFLLQIGDRAIGKLPGLGEIAGALSLLQRNARRVQLFLELGFRLDLVPLGLPALGEAGLLFFQIGDFFLNDREPVLRGRVAFLRQGFAFDLELDDPAIESFDFFWLRFHFHADPRCSLVHQVDRFVRQEPVRDIAFGKRGGGHQGAIGDAHTMMELIFLLDPAQDRDRVFDARLFDKYGLEAPLQGGVLFDMFAIFIESRCADAMEFTARKRRLQQVGGIHRAFGRARADKRVHLVNEKNDFAICALHLVEHAFEAFFKFAAILCARNQRTHVEREESAVLDPVRHIAIRDAQGEPFGNGGLADPGLTDQYRVVLGAPRQDLDGAADFFVAANDWIDLAVTGPLGEVGRKFLERVIAIFGARGIGSPAAAQLVDRRVERFGFHPGIVERIARWRTLGHNERQEQALNRDIAIAGLGRDLLGRIEDADRVIGELRRLLGATAGHLWNLGQGFINLADRRFGAAARTRDQAGRHPLFVLEQGLGQMLGTNLLVVQANCDRLRGLQKSLGPIGKFFEVHSFVPVPVSAPI